MTLPRFLKDLDLPAFLLVMTVTILVATVLFFITSRPSQPTPEPPGRTLVVILEGGREERIEGAGQPVAVSAGALKVPLRGVESVLFSPTYWKTFYWEEAE